jgi:hypothetical protein
MQYLIYLTLGCLSILTLLAIFYFVLVARELRKARKEISGYAKLQGVVGGKPDAVMAPSMRVVIEIKNPIELAHRESGMAKIASPTAPNLVIKKVYEQVLQQTKDQLRARNVDAEVSLLVL